MSFSKSSLVFHIFPHSPHPQNCSSLSSIKQLSPTFLLFKSDSFLDFNGQKSCILILKPRYEKEYFDLETNVDVIVGGALCLENKYEEKNEEYLISHSQYMLIGRIEKINVGNNQLNS